MFTANNGTIAISHAQEGINSSGSLTKSLHRPPEISFLREQAQKAILNTASQNKIPVGRVIQNILGNNIEQLQSFVQARGETPRNSLNKLAIQAALLRATEIGMVARALDTDDTDALYKIEESEQQAIDDNQMISSSILSPDVSASLSLMLDRLSSRYFDTGGSGEFKDWVSDTRVASNVSNFDQINCGGIANNAVGDEYLDEFEDNYGPIGGTSSGSWWDNLFGNIDKTVDAITKAAGAVNTTVGNVKTTYGGILDQATDIGGTIGAKSIQQYLQANWIKIVVVIVVIILFTILVSRAVRNK